MFFSSYIIEAIDIELSIVYFIGLASQDFYKMV